MKKFKKLMLMLTLALCLVAVNPLTSYATESGATPTEGGEEGDKGTAGGTSSDGGGSSQGMPDYWGTGDAIQDIMNTDTFQGAIGSIRTITEFTDLWFTRIITFVAFFIISAAMLKNVCAGAYCSNSKFWDKVHDAHKASEQWNLAKLRDVGQNITNISAGGVRDALLGIIPDIKAWTDFEDTEMEPKHYWSKAIPQMLACVIIGIFIYNGYYRDTAGKVGEMGSVIIERTLNSVNPESFVNGILNTTTMPDWPTKNDPSTQGKIELAICKEITTVVLSEFSDMDTATAKATYVATAANRVRSDLKPNFGKYYEPEDKKKSYKIAGLKAVATPDGVYTQTYEETVDDNGNVIFKYYIPDCKTALGVTSVRDTASNYGILVTGTLKVVAEEGGKGTSDVTVSGYSGEDTTLKIQKVPVMYSSISGGKAQFTDIQTVSLSSFISNADEVDTVGKLGIKNYPTGVDPDGSSLKITGPLAVEGSEGNYTAYVGTLTYNGQAQAKLYITLKSGS